MASPAKKTVNLFYDVISPYSWIAFEVLCRYKTRWQMDLQLRPFFLGGIMKGANNQPGFLNPRKAMYQLQDLERLQKHYKIPLRLPQNFNEVALKAGTLPALRFLTAVSISQPQHLESITRELFMRFFGRNQDISETASLAEAARNAGLSESVIKDTLANLASDKVKGKLKETTDEALSHGAFGAPTMILQTESGTQMIWGSDRLHILADLLGEKYEGPLTELAKSKL